MGPALKRGWRLIESNAVSRRWDWLHRKATLKSQTIIRFGAGVTLFIFLFNIISLVWAVSKNGSSNGITTLYEGSCSKANNWNTGIHVAINVLSIILLAASNYTMQCLAAPTRRDLDRAHSQGRWLDVGVPSLRNLSQIGIARVILWVALAVTSMPIALL